MCFWMISEISEHCNLKKTSGKDLNLHEVVSSSSRGWIGVEPKRHWSTLRWCLNLSPYSSTTQIGVAGGNLTLRLLGISGLTAEDSSHIAQVLAVLSNTNQQPIRGHLPHKKKSCKHIFPAFVALTPYRSQHDFPFVLLCLNYATWSSG